MIVVCHLVIRIRWSLSVMWVASRIVGGSRSKRMSESHHISSIWLDEVEFDQVGVVIAWNCRRLVALAMWRFTNSGYFLSLEGLALKSPSIRTFQLRLFASRYQERILSCVFLFSVGWLEGR